MTERDTILGLMPTVALAALAIILLDFVDQGQLRLPLLVGTAACALVAAWRTAVVFERPRALRRATDNTSRSLDTSRRSPGINPDTGLYAPWYFRMRLAEDVMQAERLHADLALVQLRGSSDGMTQLRQEVSARLRIGDVPGDYGDVLLIALSSTTAEEAGVVAARIVGAIEGVTSEIITYAEDSMVFEELYRGGAWLPDAFYDHAA
jgi:hypothetical protein